MENRREDMNRREDIYKKENLSKRTVRQRQAGTHRTKGTSAKRRKARKRTSVFYKVVALVFIAVIIIIAGIFIKNFGAGSQYARKGMDAYNEDDYSTAIENFAEAVIHDGNNMTYRMELGMAQIKNAAYDDAIATFTEMEDRAYTDTDRQSAWRGIGIAYLYKSSYEDAVTAFTNAMQYAGKKYTEQEIDILYYLAEAQDRSGDPVEAVLTYTKILEQQSSADIYLLRGAAYQKVGDNTNAAADLTKAIEMSKQDYKVYMMLYQVLVADGQTLQAEKLLEEAVTLPVKSSEDYSNRGLLYMYMKNYDFAMADFDYAISTEYWPAHFNKASLLMKQGKMEDAVANFTTYFEHVTDNALAYNEYGVCMMSLARYEEAADAFEKGIAVNDRTVDQELMYNILVAYERLAQWDEAYIRAQAYLQKYPGDERVQKELTFIESRIN